MCDHTLQLAAMTLSAHSGEEVTPPPSIRAPPLTPPPTDEKVAHEARVILREIEQHLSAPRGEATYKVEHRVWDAVFPSLQNIEKLRFDYFPSSKLLVLRMALTVHEIFTRRLNWRITEELRLLSQGSGSTADFAKSIIDVGSSMTRPRDPEFGPHHPDISFRPLKSPSPTVIIEIAHSQKKKRLRALADEYILGSNLGIQVVVGVDIEYKKSKRATFSVWKAGVEGPDNDSVWFAETVVENEIFRQDDGKPRIDKDAGLRLHLKDFADPKTCQHFENIDADIFISCGELYQYVEEAEVFEKIDKTPKPERDPRQKKRRRSPTPGGQLDDRDEERFVRDEERVSKLQDADDSSYEGSSS